MARIRVKSVYEKAEKADGLRVLVTRLWPRGVKKTAVDVWLPALGPTAKLLADYKAGKVTWEEYTHRYMLGLADMRAQLLLVGLRAMALKGHTMTLMCVCPGGRSCHRHLLQRILKGRLEAETWPLAELLRADLFAALAAKVQRENEEAK